MSAVAFYRIGPEGTTSSRSGTTGSSRLDGAGTTDPGILLVVAPTASATLEVTEVVLLAESTRSIAIRPPDVSAAGTTFAGAPKPYASKVRIIARNQAVPVPDGLVNRSQTLTLDEPTRRIEMRYELERSVVLSRPSTNGRALGAIRPLTGDLPDALNVMVVTVGAAVRNVSCPGLTLSRQACATGKPPLLRLRQNLPWRAAVVLLQLDLPKNR